MKFKMVGQEEAMLSLTSEGLFSTGLQPSDYNKYIAMELFETISLDGGTLYSLLKQLKDNTLLSNIFKGTMSYDCIVDYLSHINWDENKNLYKEKFGDIPKFSYLKIAVQTYIEDGVLHLENRLAFKGVTIDGNEMSLFGERLEEILDIPLQYDGVIHLESGGSAFKPLIVGELINTLTTEVYCMTEGSKDVSENLNYLPNK